MEDDRKASKSAAFKFMGGKSGDLGCYSEKQFPGDDRIFQDCLRKNGGLQFGQWDYLTVLAWVGSRDAAFTAGVQRFCNLESITPYQAGPFWNANRLVIAGAMEDANQCASYEKALTDLREALEGERLRGTALREKDGERVTISGDEWKRGFGEVSDYKTFSLVAGYRDHLWLSHDVVVVFPGSASARVEPVTAALPHIDGVIRPRGKLPANAKPNDKKYEEYAHEAAILFHSGKATSLQDAFKSVAPKEPMRDPDSVVRAIRHAYDLMYDKRGVPI